MIPRALIGQPDSAAFVGSSDWHRRQLRAMTVALIRLRVKSATRAAHEVTRVMRQISESVARSGPSAAEFAEAWRKAGPTK